ncbi:MAG: DUF1385 domain-containing protein [Candidatus Delongbacteria bacterium]|nr:DUF1385 domain-containing protein [Candidatus Delongbacteria bacterium]MDD4205983.1 DUF1385 domain-containing protein [Candidatus Delongbacteria bacterium]
MKKDEKISIGGQAVIEGVMMRSPEYVATVIRRADGTLENRVEKFIPASKRKKIFNIPVIRGAIGLYEMMKLGVGTLNWSADKAIEDEKKAKGQKIQDGEKTFFQKLVDGLGTGAVLIIALAIFMYVPYKITDLLKRFETNQFLFNLSAGIIRTAFIILYMYAISFMKDVKRLFQYHGAEHKSIAAYEKGLEMTVENVKIQTRFHPRCGTSFILIAAIITIIIFSLFDSFYYLFYTYPNIISRIMVHLMFMPVAVGVSYELLKMSEKYSEIGIVKVLIQPGLWLQHITTNEPDESQLDVAIESVMLSTEYLRKKEVSAEEL